MNEFKYNVGLSIMVERRKIVHDAAGVTIKHSTNEANIIERDVFNISGNKLKVYRVEFEDGRRDWITEKNITVNSKFNTHKQKLKI